MVSHARVSSVRWSSTRHVHHASYATGSHWWSCHAHVWTTHAWMVSPAVVVCPILRHARVHHAPVPSISPCTVGVHWTTSSHGETSSSTNAHWGTHHANALVLHGVSMHERWPIGISSHAHVSGVHPSLPSIWANYTHHGQRLLLLLNVGSDLATSMMQASQILEEGSLLLLLLHGTTTLELAL